jgi:hypothetical protein
MVQVWKSSLFPNDEHRDTCAILTLIPNLICHKIFTVEVLHFLSDDQSGLKSVHIYYPQTTGISERRELDNHLISVSNRAQNGTNSWQVNVLE